VSENYAKRLKLNESPEYTLFRIYFCSFSIVICPVAGNPYHPEMTWPLGADRRNL